MLSTMIRIARMASAAALLAGCASWNTLDVQVSSYGPWPAQRSPGSFVFERLPSQAESSPYRDLVESAAAAALETAGFRRAPSPDQATHLVQLGAQVSTTDPWFYNQALFVGWGARWPYDRGVHELRGFPGRGGPWGGWSLGPDNVRFDREVALLIRDKSTGSLLYEAHARSSGGSPAIDGLLPALFRAALHEFPADHGEAHPVRVPLGAS